MIIECINCSKIFDVNSDLIPSAGRTIQCGSCDKVWFFDPNKENLKIKEELAVSIMEVVEANNAGFAFPSQSLYVESYPNEKSEIFNPKNTK